MNTLLNKKWIGALLLVLTCVYLSFDLSRSFTELYKLVEPVVKKEIGYFLPISIEDGAVVEPKNAVVQKQYGEEKKFTVEINTEVEELDAQKLESGVYLTKNNLYVINKAGEQNKIETISLEKFPNIKIDEEMASEALIAFEQYAYKVLLIGAVIVFLFWGFLSISVTSVIASIFVPERWGFKFRNILRVNTLMFILYLLINFVLLFDFAWLWLMVISIITTIVCAKTQVVKA